MPPNCGPLKVIGNLFFILSQEIHQDFRQPAVTSGILTEVMKMTYVSDILNRYGELDSKIIVNSPMEVPCAYCTDRCEIRYLSSIAICIQLISSYISDRFKSHQRSQKG